MSFRFILGLLIGLMVGASLALAFAPQIKERSQHHEFE